MYLAPLHIGYNYKALVELIKLGDIWFHPESFFFFKYV